MCGRSCKSQSLGSKRMGSATTALRCPGVTRRETQTLLQPQPQRAQETPGWGNQRTAASQGGAVSRPTSRKKQGHCSSCCEPTVGRMRCSLSKPQHTHTAWGSWSPSVLCHLITPAPTYGQHRWMHSSWHNTAEQHEKGKKRCQKNSLS